MEAVTVKLDHEVLFPKEFSKLPHDEYHYEESTGMEYYFYRRECDHVLGLCHDGVGQMSYYYIDESDWDKIVDGALALQEDGWRVTGVERDENHPGFGRITAIYKEEYEATVERDPGNEGIYLVDVDMGLYHSDIATLESLARQALV